MLAFDPDGTRTVVCEVPGQPSGLGFTPDGDLLVVSMLDRRLLRLRGGELTEVADLSELAPHHCNDMCVDADGRAYVGNFGADLATDGVRPTPLLRVDPDGSVTVAAEDLVFPNGIVATPDGTLLVAETFAYRVSAFDIGPEGTLTGRREWAHFGSPQAPDYAAAVAARSVSPDGVCLDAEGALWVADATGAGAHRVREGGEVLESVSTGDVTAFAVALGGEDGRTLYLCAGPPLGRVDPSADRYGSILTTRVDVPGAAWASGEPLPQACDGLVEEGEERRDRRRAGDARRGRGVHPAYRGVAGVQRDQDDVRPGGAGGQRRDEGDAQTGGDESLLGDPLRHDVGDPRPEARARRHVIGVFLGAGLPTIQSSPARSSSRTSLFAATRWSGCTATYIGSSSRWRRSRPSNAGGARWR